MGSNKLNDAESEEYCISLIKVFLKRCKINLDNLSDYFLGELYQKPGFISFGPIGDYPDWDDSEIVKAIQFLFYKSKELNFEFYVNSKGYSELYYEDLKFTGDTINTFATLFGGECERSIDRYIDDKRNEIILPKFAEDLKNEIINFYKNYLKIGNFMLLPCASYKRKSLNTLRSSCYCADICNFNDYFLLFLDEMRKCFEIFSNNESFLNLANPTKTFCEIININKTYFKDKLNYNFNEFIDINALDDYKNYNAQLFIARIRNSEYTCDRLDEYIKFAINYMQFANDVIISRGERMIESIKPFFA